MHLLVFLHITGLGIVLTTYSYVDESGNNTLLKQVLFLSLTGTLLITSWHGCCNFVYEKLNHLG